MEDITTRAEAEALAAAPTVSRKLARSYIRVMEALAELFLLHYEEDPGDVFLEEQADGCTPDECQSMRFAFLLSEYQGGDQG